MSGYAWFRASADRLNGCGTLSGLHTIKKPDGWYLIDGRPGKKTRMCGPFSDWDAARQRGEREIAQ